MRTCRRCHLTYAPGQYAAHTALPAHQEALNEYQPHPSDAAIVAAVLGPPNRAFADVAREHEVSRERVRQIMLRNGYTAASFPKPPKPVQRRRYERVTCAVCGVRYRRGTYDEHLAVAGHTPMARLKLSPDDDRAIAAALDAGEHHAAVAERFGISDGMVYLAAGRGGRARRKNTRRQPKIVA